MAAPSPCEWNPAAPRGCSWSVIKASACRTASSCSNITTTSLTFPPGYLRAFRYCLACEIAPEFGVEPPPQVVKVAISSKRDLKRINNPDDVMSLPYSVVANRQRFNIYAGNY